MKKDIIQKIIEAVPNCSLITHKDKGLYNDFLKSENKKYPYHYSRSWTFIEQISQISKGRGIKYFDKDKGHLITIAPDWGGKVPNYIYLPLGKNAIESLPFIAKELAKILKEEITVKKLYGDENKKLLLKEGFKEPARSKTRNFENLDDDFYPEVICDVDSIIKASFGFKTIIKMDHFRNNIRKIKKKALFEFEIIEKNLSKKYEKEFKKLVDEWSLDIAKRTIKRFKKTPTIRKLKTWMAEVYYPHFIKEYSGKVDNKEIISYITFINKKAVAFTSAYPVSKSCLAVNASFCDTKYPGLAQYQFFRLALKAKVLGYRFLNLGSNDIEEQYKYKSSMGKFKEVYPYLLVY